MLMRPLPKILGFVLIPIALLFMYCQSAQQAKQVRSKGVSNTTNLAPNGKKWNILFIAVDDLNHRILTVWQVGV
jgi:hypothetical protein